LRHVEAYLGDAQRASNRIIAEKAGTAESWFYLGKPVKTVGVISRKCERRQAARRSARDGPSLITDSALTKST
jgi:hypothetical protein